MANTERVIKMKPHLHCIEGGVGKHLQFTSLFKKIIEKYKMKLAINSAYPEIFTNCTEVADSKYRCDDPLFSNNYNYFSKYDKIFFHDPYRSNFLKGGTSVVKNWAELYEIEVDDIRPCFEINTKREKILLPYIQKINNFVLLQFTGGQAALTTSYDCNNHGRNYKYGQELIDNLREQFPSFLFFVFGHSNEKEEFIGETKFNDENGFPLFQTREDVMILSKYCKFFITIDSALHHMGSNQHFNKKGIVLWGTTEPERYGYKENINLQSEYPNCVEIPVKQIMDEINKI